MRRDCWRGMTRVLVTGSRALVDPAVVHAALNTQKTQAGGAFNLIVRHGACPLGADLYADQWCGRFPQVVVERYPADWDNYGKAAGHIRNKQMCDQGIVDVVLAFPRGEAKGTMNCVGHARKAGIPVVFF